MNSWIKQRKACLISLVLAFALAACDGEPEQKSDSAPPQDSITENQATTNQPTDNQEAAQQPEPEVVAGATGEEPLAGGESFPPDQPAEPAPEPVPEVSQDAEASPPIAEIPPPAAQPPAKAPMAQAHKEAVPPRKPGKLAAAAKAEKPARPPARKPEVIPANLPAARLGGSIQQAVAVGPAERLPSDPSIVPTEVRMGMRPDLSQMQFKIQEIHFNPGSANLTPGGERKTLTASRFISDLQVRSVRVVGYADTVGPTAFNQELALARAGSVADLLRRSGVPDKLIETVGMGEAKMPMPTTDDVSEPLNRCVGILVSVNEVH